MTKQFLDATKIGTPLEQMRRGSVTQTVWPHDGSTRNTTQRFVHDTSNAARLEPAATRPQQKSGW